VIAQLLDRLWSPIAGALVPILLGLLATASIGLTVQTIRIEGLRIWPIKITGLKIERDQWRSAEHDWRRAAEIMRGSYDALHQALGVQRAAVDQLKAESTARQAAGKAARAEAAQRGSSLEAMAKRIEAAPPAESGACRTPDAVMAAKGEL
jgi:hypothetical protein